METQDTRKRRALIFEDEDLARTVLARLFRRRGYEVYAFPDPSSCPLDWSEAGSGPCGETGADVIISDVNMPTVSGLQFVEEQKRKGCTVRNIALMSGAWSVAGIRRARELNCKVFHKPIPPGHVDAWLDACERSIDPDRILAEWPEDNAVRAEEAAEPGSYQVFRHD